MHRILRSPGWHNFVRGVHRRVHERRYGRDPNEPLYPGEATAEPRLAEKGFMDHFVAELRNQVRGTPTDPNKYPPARPKK